MTSAVPEVAPVCTDPVFVLCTSRSGSTLLRFVLDAHPDLACPPELKLPHVVGQLARLWTATDALAQNGAGNGGQGISDAAAAGIRHTLDLMIGPYLAQRGKKRYCDKNLATEPHVETLLALYPEAKFICLYRHPMDMIASGVEACPWGLNQYGFEPYVANAPGNSVLALARYWADHIGAIIAVEEKFPGKCHRVRYEDLVADPESVASGIFGFLGLVPVPGISGLAFSRERERSGPGDFKIWNTSQITDDSVGRGWSVPADLIPAPLTATINGLADKLGYVRIDTNWGTVSKPADMRLPAEGQAPAPRAAGRGTGQVPPGSLLVSERLQVGMRRIGDDFVQQWKPYSDGSFLIVALASAGTDDDIWWLVNLADRKVVSGSGNCGEDRGWTISAPAATWEQVIRDGLNIGIAFRRYGMRYRDSGGAGAGSATADIRVSMMLDLLGVVTWAPGESDNPAAAAPLTEAVQPGDEPGRAGQDDGVSDDEIPPWERDRQPPPPEADLDAVLWQGAPAERTPRGPRVARISISTAGRTGTMTAPGEARELAPQALAAKPEALAGPAWAPKPADALQSSRRTAGKNGRGSAAARERLRVERELQMRRRRFRFRMVTVGAIAVIAAAVATSVALQHGSGTSTSLRNNTARAGFGYPGPYAPVTLNADNSVTMALPGVTQPVLAVYEDFQCLMCRAFEKNSGATIQRLADEGKVKVVYYPFTDFSSQPQRANSIRAWAAARCVPANDWAQYHNLLFASQPSQTTADGFAVSLLLQLGKTAGITSPNFAHCVQSQQNAVQDPPLSDQIMNSGVNGMLTLKLNGEPVDPRLTSSQLRQQIISASSGTTTAQVQASFTGGNMTIGLSPVITALSNGRFDLRYGRANERVRS